jgi:transposase
VRSLDRNIEERLDKHEIGKLLTTIEGIGAGTAARLIATLGNPAYFAMSALSLPTLGTSSP